MEHPVRTPQSADEWFAAQVWAGREHLCAEHLMVRAYDVLLPTIRQRHQWSDRVVQRALLDGYLFCRVSPNIVGKLVTSPGVIALSATATGRFRCLRRKSKRSSARWTLP